MIWKTVTGILNFRLMLAIQFHNTLNGFHTGRITGNDPLEANLLQKLTDMREDFLYDIFLDLHKAYIILDCGRCLDILAVYGVGTRVLRLIQRYWDRLSMVAWSGGYFGYHFKGHRGVAHGYLHPPPPSHTIFNMLVDAVLHHWVSVVAEVDEGQDRKVLGRASNRWRPTFKPMMDFSCTHRWQDSKGSLMY